MATIPFDSVQYCETDESLVGGSSIPHPIRNGENYIGVYNFNPGYSGTVKTLSVKTKVNWTNPNAIPLSGSLYLKIKQYDQSDWQILDSYNFNSTDEVSGEVDFSLILISGETTLLSGISETPLIMAVTGLFFDVGEELLSEELIVNSTFASGEDDWNFTPTVDMGGNESFGGAAVPNRMTLCGCKASPVNYTLSRFDSSFAESSKFMINPNRRYKFTTYSAQSYIESDNIQDMQKRIKLSSLQQPKIKLSLSGELIVNSKAKNRTLYEWGFEQKDYRNSRGSLNFSIHFLDRRIPAYVKITDRLKRSYYSIDYGMDYELQTYLDPRVTQSGESALIIESTGAYALIASPGMPHGLSHLNISDNFKYISLKEVTQEGTGTSDITLEPSALIVRCMGETIE
jgi:hypothetical protein